MAWLKLDDAFTDHPKIMAAGPMAGWLHVCALTYCSRLLTDGFIPAGQVRKLADIDNAGELVQRLIDAGLWDTCDGGYQIHDYLDFNPSRADTLKRREYDRNRKAGNPPSSIEESAQIPEGIPEESEVSRTRSPVPTPVPTPVAQPTPEPEETPPARAREEPATAVAVVVDTPYAVVAGFLDELGTPEDSVAPAWKSKQRAIAKRLIGQGFGVDAVRRCTRFMLSETWRESPFDLGGVEKTIGSWEARGSPETAGTLKAQRQVDVTELSPAMQAIVQFRKAHEDAELHDVYGENGHAGSLPERTHRNRPRVVDTPGSLLPGAPAGEG